MNKCFLQEVNKNIYVKTDWDTGADGASEVRGGGGGGGGWSISRGGLPSHAASHTDKWETVFVNTCTGAFTTKYALFRLSRVVN